MKCESSVLASSSTLFFFFFGLKKVRNRALRKLSFSLMSTSTYQRFVFTFGKLLDYPLMCKCFHIYQNDAEG